MLLKSLERRTRHTERGAGLYIASATSQRALSPFYLRQCVIDVFCSTSTERSRKSSSLLLTCQRHEKSLSGRGRSRCAARECPPPIPSPNALFMHIMPRCFSSPEPRGVSLFAGVVRGDRNPQKIGGDKCPGGPRYEAGGRSSLGQHTKSVL